MLLQTLSALALTALIVVPPLALTDEPEAAQASVVLPPAPSADVVAAAAHRVVAYSEITKQENRADARKQYEEQRRREEEARIAEEARLAEEAHQRWHEEQDRLAAERARSAAPSVSSGSVWDHLARIRACESNNNYSAVSSTGKYRGAYQFGRPTWDSSARGAGRPDLVGVDPAAAAPADQDALAYWLYVNGGPQHWPVCSKR